MGRRRKAGPALRLKAVRDQFERWRRTRRKRTPIQPSQLKLLWRSRLPKRLWDAAVKLAEPYGICVQ